MLQTPQNPWRKIRRIAVTMGDPCGVGPEIIVKAWQDSRLFRGILPVVLGDERALRRAIHLLKSPLRLELIGDPGELPRENPSNHLFLHPTSHLEDKDIPYGNPSENACRATIENIRMATRWTMDEKTDALCTCPVNKGALHRSGFSFPGHTEFIQSLTRSPHVVMMLAGSKLRVSLVTVHESLARVPALITEALVSKTVLITAEALKRDFGIPFPRIAVAGLNPHAGENARFGREELEIIGPALQRLEQASFLVSGPHPPDTVFYRAFQGDFDAVVAMYHDQGLIPLKLVHFEDGVNISLGLPVIRTSVDHGTAYDISGTGRASPVSLTAAIELAAQMSANRNRAKASHPDPPPRNDTA